jgi:predicted DNA-binding protein
MPDELKQELDAYCERNGIKQQVVVCNMMRHWLEDAEDGEEADRVIESGVEWVRWEDVRNSL